MGKILKRNKENVPLMNPAQLESYKKHLAKVRKYTRLKRKWAKQIEAREIPVTTTFKEYRESKGLTKSVEQLVRETDVIGKNPSSDTFDSLLRELGRITEHEKQLRQWAKELKRKLLKLVE